MWKISQSITGILPKVLYSTYLDATGLETGVDNLEILPK